MRARAASTLCAQILLLTMACNRNIYVGRDEGEDAGARALTAPEREQPSDASAVLEPADAGVQTPDAAAPLSMSMSMLAPPPFGFTPSAPQCAVPTADCDGSADNGCETDLTDNPQHCGACGKTCDTPDCACENGAFVLRCPAGRADCDADSSNGCETDLQSSTEHCGACKHVCHTNGHDVVTATCVAGQCEMTCEPRVSPEIDCDHDPDNGCETYLWFDADNCGQCGNRCTTTMCEAGVCML